MKRNDYGVAVADSWRDFAPHTATATQLMGVMSDAQASGFCAEDNARDFLAYLNEDGQASDAVPDYEAAARQWCEELRSEAAAANDGHVLNRAVTLLARMEGWHRCPACNGAGLDEPGGFTCSTCRGSGWARL